GHRADLDAFRRTAHALELLNATEIDQRLRLSHPVFEPVEAVEPARQDPGVRSLLFEQLLCVGQRAWLEQQECLHDVVDDTHDAPQAYVVSRTDPAPLVASASRTRSAVTGVR